MKNTSRKKHYSVNNNIKTLKRKIERGFTDKYNLGLTLGCPCCCWWRCRTQRSEGLTKNTRQRACFRWERCFSAATAGASSCEIVAIWNSVCGTHVTFCQRLKFTVCRQNGRKRGCPVSSDLTTSKVTGRPVFCAYTVFNLEDLGDFIVNKSQPVRKEYLVWLINK